MKGKAVPFLRWAGGKTWLIDNLNCLLKGVEYNYYYEPFFGGGAVFFDMDPERAFLSDLSSPLINTYQQIKKNPLKVIEQLNSMPNTEEDYYRIRAIETSDNIELAAIFIYLNATSFNGLYRVNRLGKYNVPYGRRKNYNIDKDKFLLASRSLKKANVKCCDFMKIKDSIQKGDLVFLDPPYTVSHNNNGFIAYNQNIFKLEDQYRLAELIDHIDQVGAYYVLTNAAHEEIERIFKRDNQRMLTWSRASTIGGKNAVRQKINEFIFTNIQGVNNEEYIK